MAADHRNSGDVHHTHTVEVADARGNLHEGTGCSDAEAREKAEEAANDANRSLVRPDWF